jgi:hypothetical protein
MKITLLMLITIISVSLSAQITIDQSDMSQIGDVINRKSDTMTVLPGPGPSGANQTWVMNAVSQYVIDENTSVMSVASTPNGASFSSSNIAMTSDNSNYFYFNSNALSLSSQGLAGDLFNNGSTITAPLNPDMLLHNFPRNYGDNFSDNYLLDITVNGSIISPFISQIHFKRTSTVKDSTDGWGNIITPVGTYNTLRVKRVEFSTDSIWIQAIFPPTWSLYSVNVDTSISYQWLGKHSKLAVAEMSFDTLGVPSIFKWTTIAPNSGAGITEENNLGLSIYPNPATQTIQIDMDEQAMDEKIWRLFDHFGSLVHEETFSPFLSKKEINVQSFSAGIYSWELISEKNKSFQRGKITIIK